MIEYQEWDFGLRVAQLTYPSDSLKMLPMFSRKQAKEDDQFTREDAMLKNSFKFNIKIQSINSRKVDLPLLRKMTSHFPPSSRTQ